MKSLNFLYMLSEIHLLYAYIQITYALTLGLACFWFSSKKIIDADGNI
jgi:hypothetical protein